MAREERCSRAICPSTKSAYCSPLSIIDNAAYEFYRLAPPGIMQVMIPIGLAEFSAADVDRALFKPLAANLDKLMERGVSLVVQSGTPLPTLIGVAAHDRMIEFMAKHTGVRRPRPCWRSAARRATSASRRWRWSTNGRMP